MDIKPFLHKHYLLYDCYYYYEVQERCNQCSEQIYGTALACESCKFWLHQSCAEQQLPSQISHPLHSQHFLDLFWEFFGHFICNKCFNLSKGCGYRCRDCSFNLDVLCASSTNDQAPKEEIGKRYEDIGKTIKHFCHYQDLTLVNYRKVGKYEYCCSWCDKRLSGLSYLPLASLDEFFLHESCFTKIPNRILAHPFHPSHPLSVQRQFFKTICNACGAEIDYVNAYHCTKCYFSLHVLCCKLKPTLKHYCHDHHLTYIPRSHFHCSRCYVVGGNGAFYRCLQCNFNIHVECLIPSSIKHKYHRHPLTLYSFFREDYSAEHYCDICEEHRNPKSHVYCCKECTYIVHIECALDMFIDTKFDLGSISSLKHEEKQQTDASYRSHPQVESFYHPHPLSFKRVIEIEEDGKLDCEACHWEISDNEAYVCGQRCKYYLHKTCAELPFQLNLHFHRHPLTLLDKYPFPGAGGVIARGFICDRCRDVSYGFMYFCFQCNFKVDIKCVNTLISLITSKSQDQDQLKDHIERHQQTKLFHFCHPHELLLGYFRPSATRVRVTTCIACYLPISGPAYCCFYCDKFFHESCLWKFPPDIQIPLHPAHTLHPYVVEWLGKSENCLACKSAIDDFGYRCSQCKIYLHYTCTTLRRSLTSKFHFHKLYFFRGEKDQFCIRRLSQCGKCNKTCSGREPIYCCIECNTNFHLKCVGVADRVKSKRHIHNLILKESFVEDDLEEYYCDICEEERRPQDGVYVCQECCGLFVAHIECALAEAEEVVKQ